MARIAKVVVEISLDREFDYRIPAHLQSSIHVGTQVVVPFQSRELRGFVVGLAAHSDFGDKLKENKNQQTTSESTAINGATK